MVGGGFGRNLNDREIDEYSSLLDCSGDFYIDPSSQYKRLWSKDSSGFSCKSYFHGTEDVDYEPFNFIWKSSVPYRIELFVCPLFFIF